MSYVSFPNGPDVPGAILVPAHISNVLGPGNRARVLVLHTPEERADDVESTPAYFRLPGVGASTQFYDDNDGDLFQMVPCNWAAIANGVEGGKPYPADCNPNISLNYQSESIEVEGYAADIVHTLTAPQRRTLVLWIVRRAIANNIAIDRLHVIGHYEVARKSCPGTLPIDDLVREAQQEEAMIYQRVAELEREVAGMKSESEQWRKMTETIVSAHDTRLSRSETWQKNTELIVKRLHPEVPG